MGSFIHLKTGNIYRQIGVVLDKTSCTDGRCMILYTDGVHKYVREKQEFESKFKKMKSSKPIFITILPNRCSVQQTHDAGEILKKHEISKDYHCLVFSDRTVEEVQFKVLNAKDADDVKIEEVIQMVEVSLKLER